MTPLEQTSKHVTNIFNALMRREMNDYRRIFPPFAIHLLKRQEEELRHHVLFGWEEQLPNVAKELTSIFKTAWLIQEQIPKHPDVKEDTHSLHTLSGALKGLVTIGNNGHFFNPNHDLEVILNLLIEALDARERFLIQHDGVRLPNLP